MSLKAIEAESFAEVQLIIKHIDPYSKRILGTASHVLLYPQNLEIDIHQKAVMEGTFYIYNRKREPLHHMIILNRFIQTYWMEPITQALEPNVLQLQQMITYRSTRNLKYIMSFRDVQKFVKISVLIKKLFKVATIAKIMHIPTSTSVANSGVDIRTLLTEGCVSKPPKSISEKPNANKIRILKRGDTVPESLKKFVNNVGSSKVDTSRSLIFENLKSDPVWSVKHVEEQQRSDTSHAQTGMLALKKGNVIVVMDSNNNSELTNSKLEKATTCIQKQPTTNNEQNQQYLNTSLSGQPFPTSYNYSHRLNVDNSEKCMLMTPEMFTLPVKRKLEIPDFYTKTTSSAASGVPIEEETARSLPLQPDQLRKNQIIEAFSSCLLENGPEFIDKLHEAYSKSSC